MYSSTAVVDENFTYVNFMGPVGSIYIRSTTRPIDRLETRKGFGGLWRSWSMVIYVISIGLGPCVIGLAVSCVAQSAAHHIQHIQTTTHDTTCRNLLEYILAGRMYTLHIYLAFDASTFRLRHAKNTYCCRALEILLPLLSLLYVCLLTAHLCSHLPQDTSRLAFPLDLRLLYVLVSQRIARPHSR